MGAVWALARKDLRLLMRDRMDLFFTFVFPLFIGILFGSICAGWGGGGGGGSKMKVAVVDEDGTPAAAAFIARLEGSDELAVGRTGAGGAALTRAEGDDLVR